MKIKASCKMDLASHQALVRMQMFKKADPKKRMTLWTVVYALLLVVLLVEILLIGPEKQLVIMAIVLAAVYLLECYWYFGLPKQQYKRMAHMKDVRNRYVFTDEGITVVSEGEGVNGSIDIQYDKICRVIENSHYFFIFQTKVSVFLVDKTTLSGGTAEQLSNKLQSSISGKYTICKY